MRKSSTVGLERIAIFKDLAHNSARSRWHLRNHLTVSIFLRQSKYDEPFTQEECRTGGQVRRYVLRARDGTPASDHAIVAVGSSMDSWSATFRPSWTFQIQPCLTI